MQHLLSLEQLGAAEIEGLLDLAAHLKRDRRASPFAHIRRSVRPRRRVEIRPHTLVSIFGYEQGRAVVQHRHASEYQRSNA